MDTSLVAEWAPRLNNVDLLTNWLTLLLSLSHRYHPICDVTVLRDLHGTKNGQVNMSTKKNIKEFKQMRKYLLNG